MAHSDVPKGAGDGVMKIRLTLPLDGTVCATRRAGRRLSTASSHASPIAHSRSRFGAGTNLPLIFVHRDANIQTGLAYVCDVGRSPDRGAVATTRRVTGRCIVSISSLDRENKT
jgi:hypothetical protein